MTGDERPLPVALAGSDELVVTARAPCYLWHIGSVMEVSNLRNSGAKASAWSVARTAAAGLAQSAYARNRRK